MKIETFNVLNLIPIGKVSFKFTKRFKPSLERQYVYIGEMEILQSTDRKISPETYKAVMSMMKKAKSDLLTDGHDFFTTRGEVITQIKHGSFASIKAMHKEEIHELLYK